jgi:hypothetical protein
VLTPLGRDVLAGNKDWQRIHKKTRWLGGVEISPGEGGWRWDPSEREIVRGRSAAREEKPRSSPRSAAPAKKRLRPATRVRPAKKPRPAKKTPNTKKSKSRSQARRTPRKKK